MRYVLYLLLIAAIFGLVALCDLLLKKLFRRSEPPPKPSECRATA